MKFNNLYAISAMKKIWSIIFGFGSIVFITRYLGPSLKGEYSSVINIVSITFVIFNFGIANIYPNYKRKHESFYLSTFLSLIMTMFIVFLLVSLVLFIFIDDVAIRSILILTQICMLSFQLNYLNLVENIRINAISYMSSSTINFFLSLIAFLFLDKNLIIALIIFGLKEFIIILINLMSLLRKFDFKKVKYDLWITLVLKGMVPMLTTLLVTLNYKVDLIILNNFNIEYFLIGIYATGLAIAEYTWIVPDIFKDVLINKTAKSNSVNSLTFSIRASNSILTIVFIGLLFIGKFFITLMFGIDFISSYAITMIIFFGTFSMSYTKLIGTIYTANGKWTFYFLILFISVVINLICNYITIPYMGIYGSALSSVCSYFFAGAAFLVRFKRDYNISAKELLFLNKSDFMRIFKLIKKM
ncbi:polysaccharide biosynthesis C-terminal domain-containing protein [Paenibacillus sp. FSL H7-0323]|uniref:polysaccharide biosynthesis C-terminal domain-containing protein n=1 Tax=Paenibacillus sp. FSL H7-0323 TaxID=2921433 RepID=UPI0030FB4DF0